MNADSIASIIDNNYAIKDKTGYLDVYEVVDRFGTLVRGRCCPYCGSPVASTIAHVIGGYVYDTTECGVKIAISAYGLVGFTSQTKLCAVMQAINSSDVDAI